MTKIGTPDTVPRAITMVVPRLEVSSLVVGLSVEVGDDMVLDGEALLVDVDISKIFKLVMDFDSGVVSIACATQSS